jgi:hypothetical protein
MKLLTAGGGYCFLLHGRSSSEQPPLITTFEGEMLCKKVKGLAEAGQSV